MELIYFFLTATGKIILALVWIVLTYCTIAGWRGRLEIDNDLGYAFRKNAGKTISLIFLSGFCLWVVGAGQAYVPKNTLKVPVHQQKFLDVDSTATVTNNPVVDYKAREEAREKENEEAKKSFKEN